MQPNIIVNRLICGRSILSAGQHFLGAKLYNVCWNFNFIYYMQYNSNNTTMTVFFKKFVTL